MKNLLLSLVCLMLVASPALAFLEKDKFTEAEKAGFAFYHLSKTTPDFESWIKSTPEYKSALAEQREEILSNGISRLASGFRSYHPDEDLITLRVPVTLLLPRMQKNGKNVVSSTPNRIGLEFESSGEAYFPVTQGGTWMALVPSDTKLIEAADLADDTAYNDFIKKANLTNNRKGFAPAIAELVFHPIAADSKSPVKIRDIPMWTVLVKVGSIIVFDKTGKVPLWSAQSDWYASTAQRGLMDLYGQ